MTAWHKGEKDAYRLAMDEIGDQFEDGGPLALVHLIVGLAFIGDGLLDHVERLTGIEPVDLLQNFGLWVKRGGIY